MLFLVQVIRASGSVKIMRNNLAGSVKLDDFSMSLKWSKIGNLHMYLIQVKLLSFPIEVSHFIAAFIMLIPLGNILYLQLFFGYLVEMVIN